MFSVVIPLYNKEKTIVNTIQSVLNQTYDNFEVIIVDDGSTDKSLDLAKSLSDNRIRIYKNEHKGVSVARNYAVSQSNFDLIAFLDADDWWEQCYLSKMIELIIKYPGCALYGSAYKVIKRKDCEIIGSTLKEGVIDNYFLERLQQRIMRTSATIVKKDVFISVGGFPEGMVGGEDEYAWTKIALENRIAFTPEVLATYNHIYNGSIWRKGQPDTCKESWFDFYKSGDFYRNEFVAQKAIIAGIRYALGATKDKSMEIEKKTRYTQLSRSNWQYLYFLNRHPLFIAQILYKLNKKLSKLYQYINFSPKRDENIVKSFELNKNIDTTVLTIFLIIFLSLV